MSENVDDDDSATVNTDWPLENSADVYPDDSTHQGNEAIHSKERILGVGKTLGDYELVRQIGRGGMGLVFEARQLSLNKRVAVKILPFSGVLDRRAVKRFQNEAWAAAQLDHRNIVPVYQVGEEKGVHYYVMQYVEGGDLGDLIATLMNVAHMGAGSLEKTNADVEAPPDNDGDTSRDRGKSSSARVSTRKSGWSKGDTLASPRVLEKVARNGSTSVPQFIDSFVNMGIQAAEALNFAHEMGIVHRDIKPSNLLLDLDGEVHVADFGLAQFGDDQGVTATGALVGTFAYMSPEQAMGKKRVGVDHRTDIFSLGVTLYELLTLNRAFSGDSRQEILRKVTLENPTAPRKIDRHIPVALETILMKAMAKSPADRYQTAAEMAEDLRLFSNRQPIKATKPTLSQRMTQWARANRHLAASVASTMAIGLIASIVIAGVSWSSWSTTLLALQSEQAEKAKVEGLLRKSEGLRLARDSALNLNFDPTLALLLGIESAKRKPGVDANNAILEAHAANHEIRTLVTEAAVGHVAFNADGKRLVSAGIRKNFATQPRGAILWDVATGKILHEFMDDQTTTAVTSAVYSPDNARVLTTSSPPPLEATDDVEGKLVSRSPRLWEDVTYRALVTFKDAFLFEAHDALFDPTGERIVLPTLGNSATIFDCIGGQSIHVLTGHERRVVFTAFSPKGDRVVTASDDNTVRVWNAENGKQEFVFDLWKQGGARPGRCEIDSMHFRPDGRQLATSSRKYGVHLWDLVAGERVETEHMQGSQAFYWPDDMHVSFVAPYARNLQVRLTPDGKRVSEYRPPKGSIRNVVLSPDARTIAMQKRNTTRITFWDPAQPTLSAVLPGHRVQTNCMRFSPDSTLLATASDDKTIKLWHVKNGRERDTYSSSVEFRHTDSLIGPAGDFVVIPRRAGFYSTSILTPGKSEQGVEVPGRIWMSNYSSARFITTDEGRLSLYELESGKRIKSITNTFGEFSVAALNPKGDRAAAHGDGQTITLWLPDEDRRVPLYVGDTTIHKLKFSPLGDRLVSAGEDGFARIWDAKDGNELASLAHDGRVRWLEFSQDGNRLAALTDQNVAKIWSLDSYQEIAEIRSPDAPFNRVRFNADGTRLISFRDTACVEIVVWDTEAGEPLHRLSVEGKCHVASHPTDNEMLVSSEAGAVIWQYESNRKLPITDQPRIHGSYSNDGTNLFTCSEIPWDGTVKPGELLEFIPSVLERWSRDSLNLQDRIDITSGTPKEFFVSEQDRVLLYSSHRHGLDICDVNTRKLVARLQGHLAGITEILVTPDGRQLITGSRDGRVRQWQFPDGQLMNTIEEHKRPITRVVMAGENRVLACDDTGKAILFDLQKGEKISQFTLGSKPIRHLGTDSAGQRAFGISQDGEFHLHNFAIGRAEDLNLNTDRAAWAEFAANAPALLVVPFDARNRLDTEDDSDPSKLRILVARLDGNAPVSEFRFSSPVVTSHFHPSKDEIVTLTRDGKVTLTDYQLEGSSRSIQLRGDGFYAATISPSGEWLAAQHVNSVSAWRLKDPAKWLEVRTGALALPGLLPLGAVQSLALDRFSPFVPGESEHLILRSSNVLFTVPIQVQDKNGIASRQLTSREQSRFLRIENE